MHNEASPSRPLRSTIARPGQPVITRLTIVLILLVLLSALWAGLIRLGWPWPALLPSLPVAHGALMVSGVIGALVALERAVAMQKKWMYAAPVLCIVGGLALLSGNLFAGQALIVLGSLLFVGILSVMVWRQPALYTAIMGLGALLWLGGNLLWISGKAIPQVVFWWAGFLVLTVSGERLELGRLVRQTRLQAILLLAVASLFILGLLVAIWIPGTGKQLSSLALLGMAAWLLKYDIARKTVRKPGLPRFAAICLLAGYAWLAISGILGLFYGDVTAGYRYDALLHTIFLGFILSMIFGHAPIIFPAFTGVSIQFKPVLYLPLVLLHSSLAVRVIGDLLVNPAARRWGGLFNVIALLLFLSLIISLLLSSRKGKLFPQTG